MKILVILSRVPWPLEKGDKLRAYHLFRNMAQQHEIHFCCLNDDRLHPSAMEELKKFASSVHVFPLSKFSIFKGLVRAFFNGDPFQVGYFFSKKIIKQMAVVASEIRPDHIFCQLIRTAPYAGVYDCPASLDYQDAMSAGARRMQQTAAFYMKPVYAAEARRAERYETRMFEAFRTKTIISVPDRELIAHAERDNIRILPNGVDTEYFSPQAAEKKYELVFTGNMAYPPNIDGASFLVQAVLPLLAGKNIFPRVLVAGACPAPKVLSLASDAVSVSGWVEDIRESYASSKIFAAPMRIGTGLQNKLLEAMAMGLPCITTSHANAALGAEAGKEILIADDAVAFAEAVALLMRDADLAASLSAAGRAFVIRNFNWKSNADLLSELIASG